MDEGQTGSEKIAKFTLEVINKMGIHARPAAMIVRLASRYDGEIWIHKDDERINAKSIMGIMMLAAAKGSQIRLTGQGTDAEDMLDALAALVLEGFGE